MSGGHLERIEAYLDAWDSFLPGTVVLAEGPQEDDPRLRAADLRAAVAELKQLRAERTERDFRWEEWAVQLHFPGGLTTVEHDTEDEARDHHRRLLKEPMQRAERIEVVRRVMVQGAYVAVPPPAESAPQQPERGGEAGT